MGDPEKRKEPLLLEDVKPITQTPDVPSHPPQIRKPTPVDRLWNKVKQAWATRNPITPKHPDPPYFRDIISILVGVFCGLFFLNVIQMKWQPSAFIYLCVLVGAIYLFLRHLAPHRSMTYRTLVSFLIILLGGGLGWFGTRQQYIKEHTIPESEQRLQKRFDLLDNKNARMEAFIGSFLTDSNASDAKKSLVVNFEQLELSSIHQRLVQQKKIISESPETYQQLKDFEANQRALDQNHEQQEALNKTKEEIKIREEQRQAINQKAVDDDRLGRQTAIRQRELTGRCLTLFEYVINSLFKRLTVFGNETKDRVIFDFRDFPSANNSSFVSDGTITGGTNFIGLAANAEWKFNLIAEPMRTVSVTMRNQEMRTYIAPKFSVFSRNDSSVLSIQPIRTEQARLMVEYGRDMEWPSNFDLLQISVQTNSVIALQYSTPFLNCETNVNDALRLLIMDQDLKFPLLPLPIKNK